MHKDKRNNLKSHKTKILALVLIPVLMLALLTGCTPAELGFYDLQKEMGNLNVFETKGETTINLGELPVELKEELDEQDLAMLQTFFNDSTYSYEMRVNVEEEFMEGSVYFKNKFLINKQKLLSYKIKADNIYLELDDLKKVLENFKENEEVRDFLIAVGDANYLHINSKTDLDTPLYGDGQIEKQRDLSFRLVDGLVYEVYNDFELGMIDQDGDSYTITLDANSLTNFLKPFLLYSLENSNRLGNFTKDFISNLSSEELEMFQLTPQMQTTAVEGVDELLMNIDANKEEMKAEIEKMDAFINPMIIDTLGDSKIETQITKVDDDTYSAETLFNIHIKNPNNAKELFKMSINEKASSQVIEAFAYVLPSKGVLSYEGLAKKLPAKMDLSLDGDFYTISKGLKTDFDMIETHLIDNRTYLPLRQLAEAFDEKVIWLDSTQSALLERGDKSIKIAGTIIDGKTYIQIRDFEKANYGVKWIAKTNMVKIKKNI